MRHREPAETLGDTAPGTLEAAEPLRLPAACDTDHAPPLGDADPYDHRGEHPALRAARDAMRPPWWFWEAAVAVFLLTLALSAAFPWGFAP